MEIKNNLKLLNFSLNTTLKLKSNIGLKYFFTKLHFENMTVRLKIKQLIY